MKTLSALALAASLLLPALAAAQAPNLVPVQGTLYNDAGTPIHGVLPVSFTLYGNPAGGAALWSSTMDVDFANGVFSAYLGDGDPINHVLFRDYEQVFLGVSIDGGPEMDLYGLATAPYAGFAQYCGEASELDGRTADQLVDEAVAATAGLYAPAGHGHAWGELSRHPRRYRRR